MRNFINSTKTLVEGQLTEFEKPAVGGNSLPPVADIERGAGGPMEGEFWVHDGKKVRVTGDAMQMVYRAPESFGLSEKDVLAHVGDDEMLLGALQRWKDNPVGEPASYSKGRSIGENILLERGWARIRLNLPQEVTLFVNKAQARKDVAAVLEQFPLMQVDRVQLYLVDTSKFLDGRNTSAVFNKEDFGGFAGHVNGLLNWTNNPVPQTRWLYTQAPDDLSDGLPALYSDRVRNGGSVRPGYYLPVMNDMVRRTVRDQRSLIRFPTNAAAFEQGHNPMLNSNIILAKSPFTIPRSLIQVWNGKNWAPLDGA